MTDVSERRKFLRVETHVFLHVEEMIGNVAAERAMSKNISRGGLLFEFNSTFPIGTVLSLEITLPELGKRLVCYARVVRVEEIAFQTIYDIGVCFISMSERDTMLLEEYVASKAQPGDA